MLREYEAVLKAAADPTRARVLKMLQGGEMCVCQIIAVLGLSQSTVSKHLALLGDAGLVETRKEGRWVYFTLAQTEYNDYAPAVLGHLKAWLKKDPIVSADAKKAAEIRKIPVARLCSAGAPAPRRSGITAKVN